VFYIMDRKDVILDSNVFDAHGRSGENTTNFIQTFTNYCCLLRNSLFMIFLSTDITVLAESMG